MKKAPDYERIANVLRKRGRIPATELQLAQNDEDAWVEYYLELADQALTPASLFLVGRQSAKSQKARSKL